jgi:hypothetical protein
LATKAAEYSWNGPGLTEAMAAALLKQVLQIVIAVLVEPPNGEDFALGFVTILAVNWNRFNFYLDISPCKPQKNTWDCMTMSGYPTLLIHDQAARAPERESLALPRV